MHSLKHKTTSISISSACIVCKQIHTKKIFTHFFKLAGEEHYKLHMAWGVCWEDELIKNREQLSVQLFCQTPVKFSCDKKRIKYIIMSIKQQTYFNIEKFTIYSSKTSFPTILTISTANCNIFTIQKLDVNWFQILL